MSTIPWLLSEETELEVIGEYDDESGFEFRYLCVGPLRFDEQGQYVWREEHVLALASDRDSFLTLLEHFGPDEGLDTPEVLAMLEDPANVDEETLESAIRQLCGNYDDPGFPLGISGLLADLFTITERAYRSCAFLRDEEQSISLEWVLGRCH
jgi:hypothetical protein